VLEGSPAQKAGLRENDRVVSILAPPDEGAVLTPDWETMARAIHGLPERKLSLVVEREGQRLPVEVFSQKDPVRGIGLIGIAPQTQTRVVGLWEGCGLSLEKLYYWSFSSLAYMWDRIRAGQRVDLAGPVGIVSMMGSAAKSGWDSFLGLLAIISVAIGFLNLFPIPLLDGGHVALYVWEGISRRKLTRQFLARANTIGLAVLIPIFLFAMYNDLTRMWRTKKTTEFQEAVQQP
jgi:regulator of sigma E protease